MALNRGFTLVELLVVIGVLAVLASLIIPTMGMVRRLTRDLQCDNNLSQIAKGIEAYRQNHDDKFPWRLAAALTSGSYAFPEKIFLCPHDTQFGTDSSMGRSQHATWGNYERLYKNEFGAMWNAREIPVSYCVECSGHRHASLFTFDDQAYFYRNLNPQQRTALGQRSWGEGKLNQQRYGNLSNPGIAGVFGGTFPTSTVPIVRCYWHHDWDSELGSETSMPALVNNVTLGFNTAKTIPWWELAINPLLR